MGGKKKVIYSSLLFPWHFLLLPTAVFIYEELWGGWKAAQVALTCSQPSSQSCISPGTELLLLPCSRIYSPSPKDLWAPNPRHWSRRIFLAGNVVSSSGQSSFCGVSGGNKEPAVQGCSCFFSFSPWLGYCNPFNAFSHWCRTLVYPRSSRRIWH